MLVQGLWDLKTKMCFKGVNVSFCKKSIWAVWDTSTDVVRPLGALFCVLSDGLSGLSNVPRANETRLKIKDVLWVQNRAYCFKIGPIV